jgi:hypothetical protein
VNIFLVPYTWMRHLNLALVCGGAGLLAWWLVLAATMQWGSWGEATDGPLFLTMLGVFVSAASVLAETTLSRAELWKRAVFPLLAALLTGFITFAWQQVWTHFAGPILLGGPDVEDPSVVALRYRLIPFVTTGMGVAVGPLAVRKLQGFLTHIFAGLAAGLIAAGVWYAGGYPGWQLVRGDLYLASAGAAASFGAVFGLGAWGIPDRLYAGWLRVVTDHRHGRRIPIDGEPEKSRERFVGYYPRGLDLYLPEADGVRELHISVLVNPKQEYRVRGLTLEPTQVQRFLERIDLRYDPRRSAPLETRLQSGDRIRMGKGKDTSVVEFLMLPREER